MSPERGIRVGYLLTKVDPAYVRTLFLDRTPYDGDVYVRGGTYDVVFCWNLHPEIEFIKRHTDTKVFAIGVEPPCKWPHNYDPALIGLCDAYMGYQDFSDTRFRGTFSQWVYPAATVEELEAFAANVAHAKPYPFGIFARHDPNLRAEIGAAIAPYGGIGAGPLFDHEVDDKRTLQKQFQFEFITENEINEWYMSEKLPQAILAGCVPIYYGCRNARERISDTLFIDMHRFDSVAAVIDHCRQPGVYEQYLSAIRDHGYRVLTESFSWRTCVLDPLEAFLDALEQRGWRSQRQTPRWRIHRLKRLAQWHA